MIQSRTRIAFRITAPVIAGLAIIGNAATAHAALNSICASLPGGFQYSLQTATSATGAALQINEKVCPDSTSGNCGGQLIMSINTFVDGWVDFSSDEFAASWTFAGGTPSTSTTSGTRVRFGPGDHLVTATNPSGVVFCEVVVHVNRTPVGDSPCLPDPATSVCQVLIGPATGRTGFAVTATLLAAVGVLASVIKGRRLNRQ